MEKNREITLSKSRVWLDEDNLIRVKYLADVHLALEDAQEIVAAVSALRTGMELTAEQLHYILIDDRGVKSLNRAARSHLAQQSARTGAVAVVVRSRVGEVIGNFFIAVGRPGYPAKLFASTTAAIRWLKSQRDDI